MDDCFNYFQLLKENYGCSPKCTALGDDMLKNQFIVGRNDVSDPYRQSYMPSRFFSTFYR